MRNMKGTPKNCGPLSALAGALAVLVLVIATVALVDTRTPAMPGVPAALTVDTATPADTGTAAPAVTPADTAAPAVTPSVTPSDTPTEITGDGGTKGDMNRRHPVGPVTANPDCTLKVPANPLSAQGLATPYVLQSAGMTCLESNANLAAFVQAVILDPATGHLAVYNPVVSDANTAATPPPVPALPPDAVITIWTGFNGNVLKLVGPGHRQFVNFAQQAYDNSPQFFFELRRAEAAGKVTVPALGTSPLDNMACPSTRDFSVVDQDQSDNVVVKYPQFSTTAVTIINGSDDASLNGRIDPALDCVTPAGGGGLWKVPLISDPVAGTMSTAGPLEEEQARAGQQAPVALVPGLDPFVTQGGKPNLFLQDLYRLQVGQPLTFNGNDTAAYCQNLLTVGAPRLAKDAQFESGPAHPAPAVGALGIDLATHLAARFAATWANLTCPALTGQTSPITVTIDPATMLATAAAYGVSKPVTATPAPTPTPSVTSSAPSAATPTVTPTVTPTDTTAPTATPTQTDTATPAVTTTGP
jgi:hypothetical protein